MKIYKFAKQNNGKRNLSEKEDHLKLQEEINDQYIIVKSSSKEIVGERFSLPELLSFFQKSENILSVCS